MTGPGIGDDLPGRPVPRRRRVGLPTGASRSPTGPRAQPGDAGVEAEIAGTVDEIRRQLRRDLTNPGDADFLDHVETAELCVDRGEGRCSLLEPTRIVVPDDPGGIEVELPRVGEPPGDGGLESREKISPGVQERDPRTAEQPLQPPAAEEVHARVATRRSGSGPRSGRHR